jgi:glycogen(starch) synthase
MQFDGDAETRGTPGRVVMLVDNGVTADSRVQKAARSAAEAGWDVILLGRSPTGQPATWRLGRAQVRLLPMPDPLARRRHEFRRAWLRWPLAYPPNGIAAHRAQWVKAWQADLRIRTAALAEATRAGRISDRRRRRRERALRAERAWAKALGTWVWARTKMLNRARNARKLRGPWDRVYTLFWQTVQKDRAWRRLEPGLWDYELAYGPVIDGLEPDLIHAHDFRMLGVGARAVIRARGAGRSVKLLWDAHEFLPGVQPWQDNARWLPANTAHEREYAPYADAVVTVSDELAVLLQREHGLRERPLVVLNAPATDATLDDLPDGQPAAPTTLRERCGVAEGVPLLVYSGLAAEKRGLATMIEALPTLPGAHVALVVNRPDSYYVGKLWELAARLEVTDRLHVLPYVPHWQVVSFLSTADIGVIPIHHWPNHEIALITKFFEYAHARLPVVVSDVRAMAEMVRSTGQGEVFRATDGNDFVRAVRAVLADPERYRAAYDKPGLLAGWTWEAQAEVLDGVYRRLLYGQRSARPAGVTG